MALLVFASALGESLPARAGVNVWTPVDPQGDPYRSGLALDRQNPQRLYAIDRLAGARRALLQSTDRGETWEPLVVRSAGVERSPIDVVVDPNDSDHLLVMTGDSLPGEVLNLVASRDRGATWNSVALEPLTGCNFHTVVIPDPLQPSHLFLLGQPTELFPVCLPGCANFVSLDAGQSWECVQPVAEPLYRIEPSPRREGVTLALGRSGIYRADDFGRSWSLVLEHSPAPFLSYFTDLHWADDDVVYAASHGGGLYKSTDGGVNWVALVAFPQVPSRPWLGDLAIDPFHPSRIYATTRESADGSPAAVVRSIDGGLTWESISEGLGGWTVFGLTIDPVTSNRLYVASNGGGILAYDLQVPEPCVPSATALCITDGRFKIESHWRDFAGNSGVGQAVQLASDTGSFWFFDPDNLELFVKEIDGVAFNNAFWSFYGALSNVEFTLLATDTATGAQHGYFNPRGRFASQGDILSFPQEESLVSPMSFAAAPMAPLRSRTPPARSANACEPNATTLCLSDGRFAASVTWRDFAGRTGVGTPLVLTPDTGSFWFFDAGIHELAVKVIDGRGTNAAYWVFYGSLSNVEFDLTVIDTETGEVWTRANPSGTFASGGDIEAFPQLP